MTKEVVVETKTGTAVQFVNGESGKIEITSIQGKYSQTITVEGKQKFDKAKITAVKYIQPLTGVVTNSSFNNNVSPLISVTAGKSYTISGHAFVQPDTPVGIAWYNASGVYISGTSYQLANGNGTYTAPAGAAYARYTINNVDLNTSQFEDGSAATSYATYIPNSPSPDYPSVIHNAGDVPFDVGANNGLGLSNTKTISDMVLSAVPDGTKDEFISDGITAKVITRTRLVTKSSGAVSFTDIGNGNIRSGIVLESYATSGTSPVLLSAVCDKLSSGTSSPTVANTFSVQQHQDWTGVRASICIPASYLTSQNIAGVNAWLALNPITIRYAFVTPLKPAIETAHDRIFVTSYPGTTNVYTTDSLQPTFTADLRLVVHDIDRYLNLITSEHSDKPKFKSLLSAALRKIDLAHMDIDNDFDLDNSEGIQLDVAGMILGISRYLSFQPTGGTSSVLNDSDYRPLLKAKIVLNQWPGTMETLSDALLSWNPDVFFSVKDNQDMSVDVVVVGANQLQADLISNGYIVPKPAGVKINYSISATKVFAYDNDTSTLGGYDTGTWL